MPSPLDAQPTPCGDQFKVLTELMEIPVAGSLAVITDVEGSPVTLIHPVTGLEVCEKLKLETTWPCTRLIPYPLINNIKTIIFFMLIIYWKFILYKFFEGQ
jgi:hypothetical protein